MTGSMKLALGGLGVLVVLGLLFLLALVATDPTDNVRLLGTGVRVADDGSQFMAAEFRNRTGAAYSRVEVEVDFMGPDGSLLRTTTASIDDFQPDSTWELEILVAPSRATQAILRDMTCMRDGVMLTPQDCMVVETVIELPGDEGT